MILNSTL